jgi:hypothetical protein
LIANPVVVKLLSTLPVLPNGSGGMFQFHGQVLPKETKRPPPLRGAFQGGQVFFRILDTMSGKMTAQAPSCPALGLMDQATKHGARMIGKRDRLAGYPVNIDMDEMALRRRLIAVIPKQADVILDR